MLKTIKFLALALACSGAFAVAQTSTTTGAQAQSPSAAPPASSSQQAAPGATSASSQVDETIQWLTQSVNLTPDQQSKLRPILQSEVTQMTAVNNDSTIPADQKQAKMIEIRRNAGPQIQAILTPDQQQKLAQMKAQQSGGSPQQQ